MNDFVDHPYDHDYDAMDRMCKSALGRAEKAEARAQRAENLLRRLYEWDVMQVTADGLYWKCEIEAALDHE